MIMIPSDLREAWKSSFDVDVTLLPLKYPLTEWVGEGSGVERKIGFQRREVLKARWPTSAVGEREYVGDRGSGGKGEKLGPLRSKGV